MTQRFPPDQRDEPDDGAMLLAWLVLALMGATVVIGLLLLLGGPTG